MSRPSIGDLLRDARRRLNRADFAPSTREAALLLGHVLGLGEAGVLARDREEPGEAQLRRFEALLERRLTGEPVAYLLGEREFYGRTFAVDERVLIPRPETEHLIEAALAIALPEGPRILDVGAGSGAVAVTLALEIPGSRLVASDVSLGALRVLRGNAERHGVSDRVSPLAADLVRALRLERFDLVVSNPPYVDPAAKKRLSAEVARFEPHLALFAPDGGKAILRDLIAAAPGLKPGTRLVMEIGYDQSDWVRSTLDACPELTLREIVRDYSGIGRTVVAERT